MADVNLRPHIGPAFPNIFLLVLILAFCPGELRTFLEIIYTRVQVFMSNGINVRTDIANSCQFSNLVNFSKLNARPETCNNEVTTSDAY